MITGIGVFFSSFCVCALNALQNSMLWGRERRGPEPMGGDGSAAPAGTCNFRYPVTFFAILFSLLVVRRLAAGDRPHLPRVLPDSACCSLSCAVLRGSGFALAPQDDAELKPPSS